MKIDLVSEVLTYLRRKRLPGRRIHGALEEAYTERDVREVLHALREAGYIVVPGGVVADLKKVVGKL